MSKEIPQQNIEFMQDYYGMVEKFLEASEWIAGDQMTIADFSFISFISRMQGVIPGVHRHNNIVKWIDLCKSTMIDYEAANQKGAVKYVEILSAQMNS